MKWSSKLPAQDGLYFWRTTTVALPETFEMHGGSYYEAGVSQA